MSKNLIIVESPAKVKTIKKFLGRQYAVEASVGHVRDLPDKKLGVDEESFEPEYQIIPGKEKVVNKLTSAAAKAETIYLAPDPDREGEAIAWHVARILRDSNGEATIQRIQFNEITSRAVKEALEHPRELDEDLFNSQQARRVLDRLVGYKVSPLLWKKVKRGISAGRVQSVALRLVVDREKERRAFEPEEYWVLKVRLAGDTPPPFEADLWKVGGKPAKVGSGDQAAAVEAAVRSGAFSVESVEEKERRRQPLPPFITSTLQQEANRRLGFSAKRTMSTAQRLYEGVDLGERGTTALITYMRTDSVRIANDARDAAKDFIVERFGADFYPPKARQFKTKASAQDAHEAIRPVDVEITPDDVKALLPADQFKLYKLVWERFVASQMAAATFWDTTVTVRAAGEGVDASMETLWRTKGERMLFPGFLTVYSPSGNGEAEAELPKLAAGQDLTLEDFQKEQKFTQPPPRYSEASLVKELEEKGIGRPSTYAAIISTLLAREYVQLTDKRFIPTDLGAVVSDLLTEHFETLLDVGFTASMEESLDRVATGEQDWIALLKDFTTDFYPTLDRARDNMARVKTGLQTEMPCEVCGKPMVIKFGRAGTFLACSGYPGCTNTKNFTRNEQGDIEIIEKAKAESEKLGRKCPECGGELVLKRARTGSRFIACDNYPDCTYTEPFTTGITCPKCGQGELVEKSSRRGKLFFSCSRYPDCDYAQWNPPVAEACPDCGFPVLERKNTRARGEHLACPNKDCKYTRALTEEDA
ncbi:DNA topoisomerase-1 [Desulfobaculum xiamenense]|uniref:DNA topoisomerase 1 n=1 Tax=Desulfobaculum xiamenense TaxID=995050 RepID=A0A846QI77_9BACT|nr:type I DNA topoisomerase [Desulfobaculum xiamenense]NJB67938.1 DNA topoisomerase-1 [Desulfobaculum xiamenense]